MTTTTRSRWLAPLLVAVLVVATVLIVWRFWPSGTPTPTPTTPTPTTQTTTSSTPPSSSTVPTSTTSAPSSSTSASMVAAPVHYVADVPGVGPRLYREFHRVPLIGGDPIRTALTEMFAGNPVDPDYDSGWPTTTSVLSVTRSGTTATVDVSGFVALGAAFENAAVQQLVYTATAADPAISTVRLLVNGSQPPSGHFVWSAPIERADALEIQANVWILAPLQGTTVSSPVTVKVLGTGWEGNVPLRIYRGTTVVAEGAVITMMGGFAQAQRDFALPSGTYEVRAYNDNGRDATVQLWDTKTFTVR